MGGSRVAGNPLKPNKRGEARSVAITDARVNGGGVYDDLPIPHISDLAQLGARRIQSFSDLIAGRQLNLDGAPSKKA
jgi:hypothetical protein